MNKPIIGITMGDPYGSGADISVKALADPEIYDKEPAYIHAKEATAPIRHAAALIHLPVASPMVTTASNAKIITGNIWNAQKLEFLLRIVP